MSANGFSRYEMTILVYPRDPAEEQLRGEQPLKVNVTEVTEFQARKVALERAWFSGYYVSQFLQIKRRTKT